MSVNKFGHYSDDLHSSVRSSAPIHFGLNRTREGHFDINSKRLINVAHPQDGKDVCTKEYVDATKHDIETLIVSNENELRNDIKNLIRAVSSDTNKTTHNLDSKINQITSVLPEMAANQCNKMMHELKQALTKTIDDNLDIKFTNYITETFEKKINYAKIDTERKISVLSDVLSENMKKLNSYVVINLILSLNGDVYEVLNNINDEVEDNYYTVPLSGKILQITYSHKNFHVDATINIALPLLKNNVININDKIRFYCRKGVEVEYPKIMYVEILVLSKVFFSKK